MKLRWLALTLILVVYSHTTAWANFDKLQTCGTEEVTVSTASKSLDPDTACGAGTIHAVVKAICSVSAANLRMRLDGTAPDTNTGHVVKDGSFIFLNNPGEITNARFIRDDSTDVELTCSYRRIGG